MLNLALLIPRVIIGLLFIGHGTQKLCGWFGGRGIAATASFFNQVGIRPASFWVVVAGLFETVGGALLTVGLATPLAAGLIAAVMLAAIVFVHASRGIWSTQGGIEYPLVLLSASALFGLGGAGAYALDAFLGLSWPTPALYAVLVVVALLGVITLRVLGGRTIRDSQTHSPVPA